MKFYRNVLVVCSLVCFTAVMGCETKEKIVDIETPAGTIEVNETTDSGAIEVNVDDKE